MAINRDLESLDLGASVARVIGADRLRLVTVPLLLSASVAGLIAADKPVSPHPELRAAALASFTYKTNGEEPPAAPESSDNPPPSHDPDVLELEKMEITSTYFDRNLESAVERSTGGNQPKNQRTLGTGVVEKDFGKVRMSAMTVLYIPVMIGFSW